MRHPGTPKRRFPAKYGFKHNAEQRSKLRDVGARIPNKPQCPKCGARMDRGSDEAGDFWACPEVAFCDGRRRIRPKPQPQRDQHNLDDSMPPRKNRRRLARRVKRALECMAAASR